MQTEQILRIVRIYLRIKQTDLATKLGITVTNIKRAELNQRMFTAEENIKVKAYLKTLPVKIDEVHDEVILHFPKTI